MHARLTFFKHILYFSPSFLASLFGILLRSNRLIDRGLALKIALCTIDFVFGILDFRFICIGSELCLGSNVGLPGSCACPFMFRSFG